MNETFVEEIDYVFRTDTILVDGILLRRKIVNQLFMDDYHYILLTYCPRFSKRWAEDDKARVPKYNTGRHPGLIIPSSIARRIWYDDRLSHRGDLVIAVPHDTLDSNSTIYYKKAGKEVPMLDIYSVEGMRVREFLRKSWPVYYDQFKRELCGLPKELFTQIRFN